MYQEEKKKNNNKKAVIYLKKEKQNQRTSKFIIQTNKQANKNLRKLVNVCYKNAGR